MKMEESHRKKSPAPASFDLAALRAKLAGAWGQRYWRSLDEVAETEEFKEFFAREFPDGASEWDDHLSRRGFLQLAAASLALSGLTACTKQPAHEILPYVRQPEEMALGEPSYYATAMTLGGYAVGVLAKSREGHPIKVDGNPQHPASLGGSNVWIQASISELYDPDRSPAVVHQGDISDWPAFLSFLNDIIRRHERDQGAGLRFLAETITSPTLAAQLEAALKKFPKAKLAQFDPISRDNAREGARLAFGEPVEAHYRFDRAAVILSLESDFLYSHPHSLRYAREFADSRRATVSRSEMSRLYAIESTPSVTGAMADHRLAISSGDIGALAVELARQLGVALPPGARALPAAEARWIAALARDLQRRPGKSIIIVGEWQPAPVHALAHVLNEKLGNLGATVFITDPAERWPANQLEALRDLSQEMKSGAVRTLFILGANPVYSAPADFEFAAGLRKVQQSVHLGLYFDETAAACAWHIPQAHYLEAWGDARSFDGTATMQQPLIAPLYSGKTACEILGAIFQPQPIRGDYEVVRDFWRSQQLWPDFEQGWRRAICDGFIANTALPEKKAPLVISPDALALALARAAPSPQAGAFAPGTGRAAASEVEITFRPDPCVWDGRYANNGWLQECAKPIHKLTWDNAVLISPALAERLQLTTNDMVEITLDGRSLRGPVWVMPGQAENSITLPLGHGRQRIGRVGDGVGFNAYPARTSHSFWLGRGATVSKAPGRHHLVSTQTHHNVHSPERQVHRQGTWQQFRADPGFVKKRIETPGAEETLYNVGEYRYDGYKWAMSIDLTACIGCNACLVACETENNIPVVGKTQVAKRREMYWIRIDTYYRGPLEGPEFNHMPVPCMQCEHAPCELVCPVEATVHDHEGLNLQVYNRCIGTRFCSNNCPYKVRRFNFLRYTDYHTPNWKPMYNPEVTVRWRGVMEKCTYCIQRIAAARIRAEEQNRLIRDGEIQTACQQACPAQAIVFGDLHTPDSRVGRLKQHPLDYSMLGELNTRPRTTYLAKLRNPNPELGASGPA